MLNGFFSAKVIELSHLWDADRVVGAVRNILSVIQHDTYNLKLLLIGGHDAASASFAVIPSAPYFPDRRWYRNGVATITVPFERQFPRAKTLNMLASFLAYRRARASDCYDALAVDRNGYIREGTRTNFIGVKNGELIVQPEETILLGVTQKKILEIASRERIPVREASLTMDDVRALDGAFLTSTSSKVLPIHMIDGWPFPSIPSTIPALQRWYDAEIQKYCDHTP